MSGRLEVVCGTAGSGKTAQLFALFRHEQAQLLQSVHARQAVWITPTNRSRRDILADSWMRRSGPVWLPTC